MKKIQEIIKPYLSIIFGVILLLGYMYYFKYDGAALAIAIIALIYAIYYITIGVVDVVAGDKLPANIRRIFEMISVSLFPVFVFIYVLIWLISAGDVYTPSGWIIVIYSLIISLFFAGIVSAVYLAKTPVLSKIAKLFAALFILALILAVLFELDGSPRVLGTVNVIELILYGLYAMILFSSEVTVAKE